jgi:predicted PurR-regulated permease PerM
LRSVITACIIIAALYFGRGLVVPFAFALLFSFLLSTPVIWLEKRRLPRPFAVSLILLAGISTLGGTLWLGLEQLTGIVVSFPQYQQNIVRKLEAIRGPAGQGIQNLARTLEDLKHDVTAAQLNAEKKGNPDQGGQPSADVTPVPVHIVGGDHGILSSLGFAGASVAQFAAELLAIVILTLFILLNREQLRNRVFRLFGEGRVVLMTNTVDDAAYRVSQYLLSQLLVNGTFGLVLFAGLSVIGVPFAGFWGVLVAGLRFVPYLGTFIAGLCPFVLSLAAFDGWQKPLFTLALYIAIELIVSSLVEPWLYSTRTGISSVAYLISAAFWTLLWGPVGLVLSTPLTVCLVVLGRHLPPFEFLYVLLGDEPVLPEEVRFYQRLLAEDEDEASRVLEAALRTRPVAEVYDQLIIPALTLSEQDRHKGRLTDERAGSVYDTAREIIEIAGERHPCSETYTPMMGYFACVPVRDQADEVVAGMLAQMLRQCGAQADVTSDVHIAGEHVFVLSALPPFAIVHARTVSKRIRAAHRNAQILLGVWGSQIPADEIKDRLGSAGPDWVVTSLSQAMHVLNSLHTGELTAQAGNAG